MRQIPYTAFFFLYTNTFTYHSGISAARGYLLMENDHSWQTGEIWLKISMSRKRRAVGWGLGLYCVWPVITDLGSSADLLSFPNDGAERQSLPGPSGRGSKISSASSGKLLKPTVWKRSVRYQAFQIIVQVKIAVWKNVVRQMVSKNSSVLVTWISITWLEVHRMQWAKKGDATLSVEHMLIVTAKATYKVEQLCDLFWDSTIPEC